MPPIVYNMLKLPHVRATLQSWGGENFLGAGIAGIVDFTKNSLLVQARRTCNWGCDINRCTARCSTTMELRHPFRPPNMMWMSQCVNIVLVWASKVQYWITFPATFTVLIWYTIYARLWKWTPEATSAEKILSQCPFNMLTTWYQWQFSVDCKYKSNELCFHGIKHVFYSCNSEDKAQFMFSAVCTFFTHVFHDEKQCQLTMSTTHAKLQKKKRKEKEKQVGKSTVAHCFRNA